MYAAMPTTPSRRNNAPINPPREPSLVPDPLICLSAAFLAMGLFFLAISFSSAIIEDSAGRTLARLFAGSLLVSGLLMFLLGHGLLHEARGRSEYYAWPMLLGGFIGLAAALLFMAEAGRLVALPFAFIVFAIRPIGRFMTRRGKGGRR